MKKITALSLFILFSSVSADNLLTAYRQALRNDPTYLENIAESNALKSQYNIDRATVLPTVGVDSSAPAAASLAITPTLTVPV